MPLVPREKIDDVRDRTNIVDVVKRHVELKRAGTGSWKGLCPFHSEKTPSFTVHEPRQFFHCFGCDEKGDAISFLVKIEQRPFMDVLDRSGRRRPASTSRSGRSRPPSARRARRPSPSATGCSARWIWRPPFSKTSTSRRPARPPAPTSRGAASARRCASKFRVGYAPARWDGLSSHLASKKIPVSDLERLGLCARQRARALRLLPRPRDAAGDRPPEARGRLRQPPARSRTPRTASTSTRRSRRSSTRRSSSTACTPRWTPSARAGAPSSSRGTST